MYDILNKEEQLVAEEMKKFTSKSRHNLKQVHLIEAGYLWSNESEEAAWAYLRECVERGEEE